MTHPIVKGWCPGAHRPMMSGDGLVVRVRPFRAELSATQVLALCNIATRFGNGVLDLTSRANLQIRGVDEADHPALLAELDALGLIDADPSIEGHRNILMPAMRADNGLTDRLYDALLATLPQLPPLPEKMGFALDTGDGAQLRTGSADFRFELDADGGLLLRADGAELGRTVTETSAMSALIEMAHWFVETGGRENGRMARHLKTAEFPADWTLAKPRAAQPFAEPGQTPNGQILGAPFGKLNAQSLRDLMLSSGATKLRLMLDRLFLLIDGTSTDTPFVTEPGNPLMKAHACPGAPLCPQATVETMALAYRLAPQAQGTLHVSGCAKGCAHPGTAALTLTGRDGGFDLIRNGTPWDAPTTRALNPDHLSEFL